MHGRPKYLSADIENWTSGRAYQPGELDRVQTLGGTAGWVAVQHLPRTAQVTLYSAAWAGAISQSCSSSGEDHDQAVLKQWLDELSLEDALTQTDALHGAARTRLATPASMAIAIWPRLLIALTVASIKKFAVLTADCLF